MSSSTLRSADTTDCNRVLAGNEVESTACRKVTLVLVQEVCLLQHAENMRSLVVMLEGTTTGPS